MVLPLIPVAIIAAGALTGSGGIVLGGKGALDIKKAREQVQRSQRKYENRLERSERQVTETNEVLAEWGHKQEQTLTAVVLRFAEFLRKNAMLVRENEKQLADGLHASEQQVVGPDGVDLDAMSWVGGMAASAAVGGGASVATTAAVTSLGVASTGTAISGLSGVAAQSATMAWLGGGALSAGGGGIALGATVLNFVTIGPALLIGGFVTSGQGKKAMTQSKKKQAELDVAGAELKAMAVLLLAIQDRVGELRFILRTLSSDAITALDTLESEPFSPKEHADLFRAAIRLVKAVQEVATAPILNDEGDLSTETAILTVKYRTMNKEKADA